MSLPVAAAVVTGDPDVKAHVVAELEQIPLDLGVGCRLLASDGFLFLRELGLIGGLFTVGHGYRPDCRLERPGTAGELGRIHGTVDWVVLGLKDRGHHGLAVGRLPAGWEPRKWPVHALGFLRSRKTLSSSRSSNTGTAVSGVRVATERTRTRQGNASSFQIGALSLNGSDTTSSTPIHREMPVR